MPEGDFFDLDFKPNRNPDFLVDPDRAIIATYTVDKDYVRTYELHETDGEKRKILLAGHVLALDPATKKVVPNFTVYGFGVVGIATSDGDCGIGDHTHDTEVGVLWRGEVFERYIWDDGDENGVLDSTKDALSKRIKFVKNIDGLTEF